MTVATECSPLWAGLGGASRKFLDSPKKVLLGYSSRVPWLRRLSFRTTFASPRHTAALRRLPLWDLPRRDANGSLRSESGPHTIQLDKFPSSLQNLQKRQGARAPHPTDRGGPAAERIIHAYSPRQEALRSPCVTQQVQHVPHHTAHAAHNPCST